MYYIDYHAHTQLSPDGHAPLTDMADAALAAGIRELCVTDHYDLQAEHGGRNPAFDWAPALEQYSAALPRYEGRLTLRLGIELGGAPVDPDSCADLLRQPELDFVIGSIHNLSPQAGGEDFYYADYTDPAVCAAALDNYIASLEALAPRPELYDVLGHIIYPLRYMPPEASLAPFWDRISALLRTAVQYGRGIELNTCRGTTVAEWRELLALYRSLGGEIITVGADAHVPESVGKGVAPAYELLRETGFRYITVYEKRRPVMIKL